MIYYQLYRWFTWHVLIQAIYCQYVQLIYQSIVHVISCQLCRWFYLSIAQMIYLSMCTVDLPAKCAGDLLSTCHTWPGQGAWNSGRPSLSVELVVVLPTPPKDYGLICSWWMQLYVSCVVLWDISTLYALILYRFNSILSVLLIDLFISLSIDWLLDGPSALAFELFDIASLVIRLRAGHWHLLSSVYDSSGTRLARGVLALSDRWH